MSRRVAAALPRPMATTSGSVGPPRGHPTRAHVVTPGMMAFRSLGAVPVGGGSGQNSLGVLHHPLDGPRILWLQPVKIDYRGTVEDEVRCVMRPGPALGLGEEIGADLQDVGLERLASPTRKDAPTHPVSGLGGQRLGWAGGEVPSPDPAGDEGRTAPVI